MQVNMASDDPSEKRRGRRCVAGGCSNTHLDGVSLHYFPFKKEPDLVPKWTAFVRLKRKWPEGPSKHSSLCEIHFDDSCYPFEYQFKKSQGFPVKYKVLNPGSVPTIHHPSVSGKGTKRDHSSIEEEGESLKVQEKGRKRIRAFVKRENVRIIAEQEFQELIQDQPDTSENTENLEELSNSKEASSQTNRLWNRKSKSIQTNTRTSNKGTQIKMYPARRSVGIQCNMKENEQHINKELPDMPPQSSDFEVMSSDSEYQEQHYDSDDSIEYSSEENEKPNAREERKFIVFESQLMKLFHTCSKCRSPVVGKIKQMRGSFISVETECIICNSKSTWNSQPYIGEVPAGNLLISTSIVLSGSIPSKALRMFEFMNVQAPKLSTFYNHQKFYIHPGIYHIWKNYTESYVEYVKQQGNPLALGGDGRADSPGHSAKYGAYSVIDLDEGLVVHIELVQSNEVKSSSHMELQGLIRTMAYFCDMEVEIGSLVTDRHVQVVKWVRENMPNTNHEFDVWHVAKGLKKKLLALSKERECNMVSAWIKSITNHLYWVAASSPGGSSQLMLEKWNSLGNHLQNVHEGHGELYPACSHGNLEGQERKKLWFKSSTKACERVMEIINSRQLQKDVPKLSTGHQTSELEAFHSIVNHFAPKMYNFSYQGMLSRLILSALHFNENGRKPQDETLDGEARYKITFPKFKKGGYTVREVKTESTYKYAETVMDTALKICEKVTMNHDIGVKMTLNPPPPLCHEYNHPVKESAILEKCSRFNQQN